MASVICRVPEEAPAFPPPLSLSFWSSPQPVSSSAAETRKAAEPGPLCGRRGWRTWV
ncbi:hypothetical protein NKH77_55170 [Streptomyces sp. M19]